jgi:hypothetical protein
MYVAWAGRARAYSLAANRSVAAVGTPGSGWCSERAALCDVRCDVCFVVHHSGAEQVRAAAVRLLSCVKRVCVLHERVSLTSIGLAALPALLTNGLILAPGGTQLPSDVERAAAEAKKSGVHQHVLGEDVAVRPCWWTADAFCKTVASDQREYLAIVRSLVE